ncbi:hypothetical protein GJ699_11575 [Duganella sp. FT80W]|uniref:Uncharacterized protein n=1 Tax=Duganella guangzhouensis TaxID=2666084 RepID=A0A6I2KXA0_9BURK|nr:hypothetical protein [Duganella guangzhouensis]MRW90628.1 hypothetical protein [Duganella guangzhouensis]
MANKQSWGSPEAIEETEGLLRSNKSRQKGIANLQKIAKTLRWAIRCIDHQAEDKEVRRKFLRPHLETLETVVGLFRKYALTKDPLMEDLLEIQRKVFV